MRAADELQRIVAGRQVVLCGSAAGSRGVADGLRRAGATFVEDLAVDTQGSRGIWGQVTEQEELLRSPPDWLEAQLDELDPQGEAFVYAGSFSAVKGLCGRRVLGVRTEESLQLEDRRRQATLTGAAGDVVDVRALADVLTHRGEPTVVRGGGESQLLTCEQGIQVFGLANRCQGNAVSARRTARNICFSEDRRAVNRLAFEQCRRQRLGIHRFTSAKVAQDLPLPVRSAVSPLNKAFLETHATLAGRIEESTRMFPVSADAGILARLRSQGRIHSATSKMPAPI